MSKLTKSEIWNIELHICEDLKDHYYIVKLRFDENKIVDSSDDIYPAISLLYVEMRLDELFCDLTT